MEIGRPSEKVTEAEYVIAAPLDIVGDSPDVYDAGSAEIVVPSDSTPIPPPITRAPVRYNLRDHVVVGAEGGEGLAPLDVRRSAESAMETTPDLLAYDWGQQGPLFCENPSEPAPPTTKLIDYTQWFAVEGIEPGVTPAGSTPATGMPLEVNVVGGSEAAEFGRQSQLIAYDMGIDEGDRRAYGGAVGDILSIPQVEGDFGPANTWGYKVNGEVPGVQ